MLTSSKQSKSCLAQNKLVQVLAKGFFDGTGVQAKPCTAALQKGCMKIQKDKDEERKRKIDKIKGQLDDSGKDTHAAVRYSPIGLRVGFVPTTCRMLTL